MEQQANGIKLAVIGGGSSYTPELVEGLLNRFTTTPIRELWLVDLASGAEKLAVITALAKRMVAKAALPVAVYATQNRKEALKGADFVITQLRVGQLAARILDERIPLSHGILGQETNGAGGLFKGLRTIPVILEICEEMLQYCPEAWLINFTNPVGMVMESIAQHSPFQRAIGLCNLPHGLHQAVAKQLGCESQAVRVTMGGLNHMLYVVEVERQGTSCLSQLLRDWGAGATVANINGVAWDASFLEALGVLPCSYHRYYYMAKEYLEEAVEKYHKHQTRAELVHAVEEALFERYRDPQLCEKPKELEKRGGAYYSDAACALIDSLYNDRGDVQVVDTVNRGAISFLPSDAVVEVSCRITKDGPVPLTDLPLPPSVQGLITQIKSFEQVAVSAAVSGSRSEALLALMMNPLVASQREGRQLLEELLAAHRAYLPQFFPEDATS